MNLKDKTLKELAVMMWELAAEAGKGDTKLNQEVADEIFDRGPEAQVEAARIYIDLLGVPNPLKK